MATHEKLSAATNDRKARLAQLKSLKRKQAPDTSDDTTTDPSTTNPSDASSLTTTSTTTPSSVTTTYLSGRNFDPATRNVKLGFDNTPISDPTKTLEYQAAQLALASKTQQETEKTEDKPLDLFTLQPKRANWDLKRDLEGKTRGLDVATENAVARIVRERVEGMKREREKEIGGVGETEQEEVGMEGSELVEAMHLKEREVEEERRRDREVDGDVS
jgi:coiled-coil domain-containing protein 12